MNDDGRDPVDDMTPAELLRHARDIKHFYDWMTSLTVGQRAEMAALYGELANGGRSFASITQTLRHCAECRGYIGPDDCPLPDDEALMLDVMRHWKKEMETKLRESDGLSYLASESASNDASEGANGGVGDDGTGKGDAEGEG